MLSLGLQGTLALSCPPMGVYLVWINNCYRGMPDLAMPSPTPFSLQCLGWQAVSIALKPVLMASYTNSAVFSFFQAVPQKTAGNPFIYIINLMSNNIEQQLILSQFSYPKYFNGSNWNTVINKSRSSIPEYLHEDLPKLKFQYLREEFKKVEQIECPRLTYFNNQMIKKRMKHHCHRKNCNDQEQHKKCGGVSEIDRQRSELDGIRSQLQYALMTSKRDSNVIRQLISKVSELQDSSPKPKKKKSRSQSVFQLSQKHCFQNTLGIVLSARRQKQPSQSKLYQKNQKIQRRVESIAMLPFLE